MSHPVREKNKKYKQDDICSYHPSVISCSCARFIYTDVEGLTQAVFQFQLVT
jgi:hypothetical protein